LASSLAVVARLIRGQLGSRVFAVSEGGFDTHSDQGGAQGSHANRLGSIADAVAAFMADLASDGLDQKVLVMTFSEFGRTLLENGSRGTDHGAGAPLMLFGSGLNGGLYGTQSSLQPGDLYNGDPRYTTDYRDVYHTLLSDWFGLANDNVVDIMGRSFNNLDFVGATTVGRDEADVPGAFHLEQNYPNPFNPATQIRYTISQSGTVRLGVYDTQGRLVHSLANRTQAPGTYTVSFDGADLPSGTYLYRLETPAGMQTRRMVLVK
jgi:hypothetical protein